MTQIQSSEGTKQTFMPPLKWRSLSCFYDIVLFFSGLGYSFKERISNYGTDYIDDATTIADIGCGTGTQLHILSRLYPKAHIIGVEPDLTSHKRIREKYPAGRFTLMHGYAESLPLFTEDLDACYSTLTFHHINTQQKKKAFAEIYRTLKPGGVFVLTDWGKMPYQWMRYGLVFEKQDLLEDHVNDSIPTYAKESGFKIILEKKVKSTGIWTWVLKKE